MWYIIALGPALVLSAVTPAGDADPLSAYPRSDAFAHNVAWHKKLNADEIRISCFLGGDPGIAMVCSAELSRSKVTTSREVYEHASQSTKTRELSDRQVLSLRDLIQDLPPSAKEAPKLTYLILVSVSEKGKAKTYLYNCLDPPAEIVRLLDLTGAYWETAKLTRHDPENAIPKNDPIYPVLVKYQAAMQKREEERKQVRSAFKDWVRVNSPAAARLFPNLRFASLVWDMHRHPEAKESVSLALGLEMVVAVDTKTNRLTRELWVYNNHDEFGKLLADYKVTLRDAAEAKLVWDASCDIYGMGSKTAPMKRISASEWRLGISSSDQTTSVVDGVKTVVTNTHYMQVLVDPETGCIISSGTKVDSSNPRNVPAK